MTPSVFLWANPAFVTVWLLSICTPSPSEADLTAGLQVDPASPEHETAELDVDADLRDLLFASAR